MSMERVKLSQILSDYKITMDADDFVSNTSDVILRNIALRGIREFGFDISKIIKSLKVDINKDNNTVALPNDFVSLNKVGIVGSDGLLYAFNENNGINFSQKNKLNQNGSYSYSSFNNGPLNIEANEIPDVEDDKTPTDPNTNNTADYYEFVFENYIYEGGLGRLYGLGGAHGRGEYRLNLDQSRIEIDTSESISQVVIEYVADQARASDPFIHVFLEEALRSYIYYKLVERKATVPANEKARARQEYYNERRKANARMNSFSKHDALTTIRKNFKLSPKF
jgi:hypothetical protein